jgi:primosomal protein N''
MSMVDELNKSKTELISANEKYKIAYTTIEKSLLKHQDIERELNDLRKELKERNERVQELQDQDRNRKHIEEYNSRLRK